MVSPFVLDNLNLGGHGGIAGLGSEETNQYSAKRDSPQRAQRSTEERKGFLIRKVPPRSLRSLCGLRGKSFLTAESAENSR